MPPKKLNKTESSPEQGEQLRLELGPGHLRPLKVAGLFAGIGGIELGLQQAGHHAELLCEVDPGAIAVLKARFGDVPHFYTDVREIAELPRVDLLAAGFPCQDLSQAGRTAGITGERSGLVGHVFRLLSGPHHPRWLLLENVPFMLRLDRGKAMEFLTSTLDRLGFNWAYRVVDSRCFGLPQRRRRVLLLASKTADPRPILFSDDAGEPEPVQDPSLPCGFYWTEGRTGLGWAVDAVPTLKGGSSIGIPSPPAIWLRKEGAFITPDIRDAEKLQGFDEDWTAPALAVLERQATGARWKMVGNAVSVPVARWIGECFRSPGTYDHEDAPLDRSKPWPSAAWGMEGDHFESRVSEWPQRAPYEGLEAHLSYEGKPLSYRAAYGFRERTKLASLRFPDGFLEALDAYLQTFSESKAVPAPHSLASV